MNGDKIPYAVGLEYCKQRKVNAYSQADLDFGVSYVYCDSHRSVHSTGWCSVPNYRKVALDFATYHDASQHAKKMGLINE